MNNLEAWAVRMAAQNRNPFPQFTPVLLYRNETPYSQGAWTLHGSEERIYTVGHGFPVRRPPFTWHFRKLIPELSPPRLIAKAVPVRGPEHDLALCTPGNVLEVMPVALPNFYTGFEVQETRADETFEFLSHLHGSARSVLTGESVCVKAEVSLCGVPHVLLDYRASDGHSGMVFIDEEDPCMYVLCSYGINANHLLREAYKGKKWPIKKGMAFALRLQYA